MEYKEYRKIYKKIPTRRDRGWKILDEAQEKLQLLVTLMLDEMFMGKDGNVHTIDGDTWVNYAEGGWWANIMGRSSCVSTASYSWLEILYDKLMEKIEKDKEG